MLMNTRNKIIVQNIRIFAQMRGTSIKQIEKDLGLGNGMIGKWEDSKRSPPFETVEVIANYLGVSILELAGIEPGESENAAARKGNGDSQLTQLIDIYNGLSQHQKDAILAVLLSYEQEKE